MNFKQNIIAQNNTWNFFWKKPSKHKQPIHPTSTWKNGRRIGIKRRQKYLEHDAVGGQINLWIYTSTYLLFAHSYGMINQPTNQSVVVAAIATAAIIHNQDGDSETQQTGFFFCKKIWQQRTFSCSVSAIQRSRKIDRLWDGRTDEWTDAKSAKIKNRPTSLGEHIPHACWNIAAVMYLRAT